MLRWLFGVVLISFLLFALSIKQHGTPRQKIHEVVQESSATALSQLRRQMAYVQARNILLAGGWRPARFPRQTAEIRCPARQDVCSTYAETDSCSDSGMLYCKFAFKDPRGKKLFVVTIREQVDRLEVDDWWVEHEAELSPIGFLRRDRLRSGQLRPAPIGPAPIWPIGSCLVNQ